MSGRRNLFLVGGILLVAILLLLVQTLRKPRPNGEVLITVDGKEYARVSLSSPQEILIDCGGGESNLLVVQEDGIYMKSATCRDQLCVNQGKVTPDNYGQRALGTDIICLPNRVVCSLVTDSRDVTALAPPDA